MNTRQKKRIKDAARLVHNVNEMLVDMKEMSKQYEADLKSFFATLEKTNNQNNANAGNANGQTNELHSASLALVSLSGLETSDSLDEDSDSTEPGNQRKRPPKKRGRPPKSTIKDLYRQVMRKCHPDRSTHDKLRPQQVIMYSWAVAEIQDAYKNNDLAQMIFIAAMVDEFSKAITPKETLGHINDLYGKKSVELNKIQNTIAWLWGINWDTLEIRYTIVQQLSSSYGVVLPDKIRVLELLVEHETETD